MRWALSLSGSSAVDTVLVDESQLLVGEVGTLEGLHVVIELRGGTRADQSRGHRRVAQHPLQRELRQRLATRLGHLVEFGGALAVRLVDLSWGQEVAGLRPRAIGNRLEVLVGEQALVQRRIHDQAEAVLNGERRQT